MIVNRELREGDVILIPRCTDLDYEGAKWIVMDAGDRACHAPCRTRSKARDERMLGDVVAKVVKYTPRFIRVKITH